MTRTHAISNLHLMRDLQPFWIHVYMTCLRMAECTCMFIHKCCTERFRHSIQASLFRIPCPTIFSGIYYTYLCKTPVFCVPHVQLLLLLLLSSITLRTRAQAHNSAFVPLSVCRFEMIQTPVCMYTAEIVG